MVTPSLVMVGAPHFLSMTTLRPRGPRVTLTASASWSTPRCNASRASEWNCRIFGIQGPCLRGCKRTPRKPPPDRQGRRGGRGVVLLLDDGEYVAGREDEVLVGSELDLGAAVLGEDDGVTLLDV